MKTFIKDTVSTLLIVLMVTGCRKTGVDIKDVSFTADKANISVGEAINFSFGDGANALALYTGDANHDFENSRIKLVEQQGYTEEQLKTNTYATRIPDLKEYVLYVPDVTSVPSNFSFSGKPLELYKGKLVPWDFSNTTNSTYIKINIENRVPYTLTIKPNQAVLPAMLNYNNGALSSRGALNSTANNAFQPYISFPDGFTNTSTTGVSVKFGVQFVIAGVESPITYFTSTVRELLSNLNFNMTTAMNSFRTSNPGIDQKSGIDEIRLIFNADNPATTDDDGDLLTYQGFAYLQQVQLGEPANMIKSFDVGVAIPYVYPGTTQTFSYTYTKVGSYKAVMVATYIGRKKYNGDGYNTDRADEISASEYEIERRFKTIDIVVK